MIQVYTDGSCLNNHLPGPQVGGYAAIVLEDGEITAEMRGGDPSTTNNQMEMRAVLEGLRAVEPESLVTVYTDSRLVVGWLETGWRCRVEALARIRHEIREVVRGRQLKVKFRRVSIKDEMLQLADVLAKVSAQEAQKKEKERLASE